MTYKPNFKPFYVHAEHSELNIPYMVRKHSAGEIHFRFEDPDAIREETNIVIEANLTSPDAIMMLFSMIGAIQAIDPTIYVSLVLPYLPYGRQDRVCHPGEDFAIQTFLRMLSSLLEYGGGWELVTWDPHSSVSGRVIEELGWADHVYSPVSAAALMAKSGIDFDYDYVVAPDAGALERAGEISAEVVSQSTVVRMSKHRNPETGYLSDFRIDTDITTLDLTKKVLIVDDICDGGRTFIGAAQALRAAGFTGEISLYITHGIFSAGYTALSEAFSTIYVANNISVCTDPVPANIRFFEGNLV